MNRTIDRLKLIFLVIFACACVAVLVYQLGWAIPRERCEAKGDWWDWRERICAHPVPLADITGRTMADVQAEKAAKAKAAAEAAAKTTPPAPAQP